MALYLRPVKRGPEPGRRYSEDSVKEYRLWMSEVFMPNNLRIEKIISENAHLIEGEMMPEPFGEMLAHVTAYKAVMKTWPDNPPRGVISYEEAIKQNTDAIPYRQSFPLYVSENFNSLKRRQMTLLGLVGQKNHAADFGGLQPREGPTEKTGSLEVGYGRFRQC